MGACFLLLTRGHSPSINSITALISSACSDVCMYTVFRFDMSEDAVVMASLDVDSTPRVRTVKIVSVCVCMRACVCAYVRVCGVCVCVCVCACVCLRACMHVFRMCARVLLCACCLPFLLWVPWGFEMVVPVHLQSCICSCAVESAAQAATTHAFI